MVARVGQPHRRHGIEGGNHRHVVSQKNAALLLYPFHCTEAGKMAATEEKLNLLARCNVEIVLGTTDNFKERLVSRIAHTVVPQPYVAKYDIDGRLVISVALRELRVEVARSKLAVELPLVTDTAFLARAQPQPP